MALVTFENGAMATVVNSVVSPRRDLRLRFDFEHATVEVEHLYGYTDADWTSRPRRATRTWPALGGGRRPLRGGPPAQFAAVLDALDAGQAPPVDVEDARRTMEFVAAVYASAFTGCRCAAGDLGAGSPFATSMDGASVPWAPSRRHCMTALESRHAPAPPSPSRDGDVELFTLHLRARHSRAGVAEALPAPDPHPAGDLVTLSARTTTSGTRASPGRCPTSARTTSGAGPRTSTARATSSWTTTARSATASRRRRASMPTGLRFAHHLDWISEAGRARSPSGGRYGAASWTTTPGR